MYYLNRKIQTSPTKLHSVDNKRDYAACLTNAVTFLDTQIHIKRISRGVFLRAFASRTAVI